MIKRDFDGGASRHLFGPYDRVTIDGRAYRWSRPGHPASILVVADDGGATVLGRSAASVLLESGRMTVEPGFHSPEAAARRLQTSTQIEGEV